MLAADIVKHPEYDKVWWDLQPAQSGKVAVAKDRWGPINIAYEVHGTGPVKLVVCSQISIWIASVPFWQCHNASHSSDDFSVTLELPSISIKSAHLLTSL